MLVAYSCAAATALSSTDGVLGRLGCGVWTLVPPSVTEERKSSLGSLAPGPGLRWKEESESGYGNDRRLRLESGGLDERGALVWWGEECEEGMDGGAGGGGGGSWVRSLPASTIKHSLDVLPRLQQVVVWVSINKMDVPSP